MSEHTESIRRAVKIGYDKLVNALDRMEKERDQAIKERDIGMKSQIELTKERDNLSRELAIWKERGETFLIGAPTPLINCNCAVCQKRRRFPGIKDEPA